jgi:hypothetical protein
MLEIDGRGYDAEDALQQQGPPSAEERESYHLTPTRRIGDDINSIEMVQIDGSVEEFDDDDEDHEDVPETEPRPLHERNQYRKLSIFAFLLLLIITFAAGFGLVENVPVSRDKAKLLLLSNEWGAERFTNGIQILPEDKGREFGKRVAISGDGNVIAVAVGTRPKDTNDNLTRKVQAYQKIRVPGSRSGNVYSWQYMGMPVETLNFENSFNENMRFTFDGHRMVVSAPYGAVDGDENLHHGYVLSYDFDGSDWQQVGSTIIGQEEGDHFGRGLAMSQDGSIIAVGAPNHKHSAGRVSIFRWQKGDWHQMTAPLIPDGSCSFGTSLAMSADGRRLAVGAPIAIRAFTISLANDETIVVPAGSGHVRVYKYGNNNTSDSIWKPVGKPIIGQKELFGVDVRISTDGSTVAIGSGKPQTQISGGSTIQIFAESGGMEWKQKGSNVVNNGYDGLDISGDGNRVVFGGTHCAKAYGCFLLAIYSFEGGEWVEVGRTLRRTIESDEEFGSSLALSSDGKQVIVGVVNYKDGTANAKGIVCCTFILQ